MLKNKDRLDTKIAVYIDNLFSGIGSTQQLFDLKEELAINMKEKIEDYKGKGMDDNQAFKEAVISMGDLRGLVDDMRKLGQNFATQAVYSTMTARISTTGIVTGVLLILFGIFTITMTYFMNLPSEAVAGSGIFVVAGGLLLTYSILTRETSRKYAMNKIRAAFYALSIGLLLFSIFVAIMSRISTNETYVAVGALMVFFMAGAGLFLLLILTESDRRKHKN